MSDSDLSCKHCGKEFTDKVKLNFHIQYSMPDEYDPCVVCKANVPTCISRLQHINSHPGCKRCKVHFKSKSDLQLHKVIKHSDDVPAGLYMTTLNGVCICYICELVFSEVYHIKVHTSFNSYIVTKRYRQFYNLFETVQKATAMPMPNFPRKTLFKISRKIVSYRKDALENWLRILIHNQIDKDQTDKFLKLNQNKLPSSLSADENTVVTFISNISKEPNKKIAYLDSFAKEFFSRRRFINTDFIENLLKTLISLCSDPTCMSKPIDIIYKLVKRDFFKDYKSIIKVFVGTSPEILKTMRLDEYLNKKINPDCQVKAYELLKLIEFEGPGDQENICKILNNDEAAISVYKKWGTYEGKAISIHSPKMIRLISSQDIVLEYTSYEKKLLVTGHFDIKTKVSRLVGLLVVPNRRKQWDLRLIDMYEDNRVYKMRYFTDNVIYDFDCSIEIVDKLSFILIKVEGFMNSSSESNFKSIFNIEKPPGIEYKHNVETKVKCHWNLQFTGKAKKIFVHDIVEENNLLQSSFSILCDLAQKKNNRCRSYNRKPSLSEAASRKLLIQT